jgi:hypothetical protein
LWTIDLEEQDPLNAQNDQYAEVINHLVEEGNRSESPNFDVYDDDYCCYYYYYY